MYVLHKHTAYKFINVFLSLFGDVIRRLLTICSWFHCRWLESADTCALLPPARGNDINHKQLPACATSEWVSKSLPWIMQQVLFLLTKYANHCLSLIYGIEYNTAHICVIACTAHADWKAFCKVGRCINLNATSNIPGSLSAHKTIYNLFPPWWRLLAYAELKIARVIYYFPSCWVNLYPAV